jgi:hypothetical protein
MPVNSLSRILIAFALLIVFLPGCALRDMIMWREDLDTNLNPWLGKSKDERMKRIGPPEQCAKLSDGGEVCDWVVRGVSYSGGNGNTWEHHAVFTYDRAGIAKEWNYRGSHGQRSSNDSLPEAGIIASEAKKTAFH